MAGATPTKRPSHCLGPCKRPLVTSTRRGPGAVPEGAVAHSSKGMCLSCRKKAKLAPPSNTPAPVGRGTVDQHRAALAAYVADRRARGIPPEGLPARTVTTQGRNHV